MSETNETSDALLPPIVTDLDPAATVAPTPPDVGAESQPRTRKLVKARVLINGIHGRPNDVVALPAAAVRAGKAAGELDDDADAVAYAEALTT